MKPPLVQILGVVFFGFPGEEFNFFGHSRGEWHLRDGLAQVMVASQAEPRRLHREAYQKPSQQPATQKPLNTYNGQHLNRPVVRESPTTDTAAMQQRMRMDPASTFTWLS